MVVGNRGTPRSLRWWPLLLWQAAQSATMTTVAWFCHHGRQNQNISVFAYLTPAQHVHLTFAWLMCLLIPHWAKDSLCVIILSSHPFISITFDMSNPIPMSLLNYFTCQFLHPCKRMNVCDYGEICARVGCGRLIPKFNIPKCVLCNKQGVMYIQLLLHRMSLDSFYLLKMLSYFHGF